MKENEEIKKQENASEWFNKTISEKSSYKARREFMVETRPVENPEEENTSVVILESVPTEVVQPEIENVAVFEENGLITAEEQTEKAENKLKKNLAEFFKKLKSGLFSAGRFLGRHKIITSVAVAIIVLVIGITSVLNHFLNKINYVEATIPSVMETTSKETVNDEASVKPVTKKLKYLTLSSGEIVDVTGLILNEDGTYTLPDWRRLNADGTIWNTDGSIVFYDGSYILPDGKAVLTDGTTFYPDGLVVFQDGTYFKDTGITTDSEGYIRFKNGVIAHITSFTCSREGICVAKDSLLSNNKYNVSGSWSIFTTDTASVVVSGNNVTSDGSSSGGNGGGSSTPSGGNSSGSSGGNNGGSSTPSGGNSGGGNSSIVPTPVDDNEDGFDEALEKISDKLEESDDKIAKNYNDNKIWYSDDITNILLMGIDNGSKRYPYGRSDSMIVLSINKKTNEVKMVSFSRAVYVAIAGYNNTRLNHAHGWGGAGLAIDTIERNYKIRIDNYVETGFDTFKQIIDVLGGIPINLSKAEAKAMKAKIKKAGLDYNGAGKYNLNGDLALEYVRLRKIDTDRERTARQRKVLLAIMEKVKGANVLQLTNLANQILPLITTDMSKTEILSQLSTIGKYTNGKIKQYVVPHDSSALTVIDNYEVLLLDWDSEVKYVHKLFYNGVDVKQYSK